MYSYPDYEIILEKYQAAAQIMEELELEDTELRTRLYPHSVRLNKAAGKSKSIVRNNPIDDYLIEKEKRNLDSRIEQAREILKGWEKALDYKKHELSISPDMIDRIYKLLYIDNMKAKEAARKLDIDICTVYRYKARIDCKEYGV